MFWAWQLDIEALYKPMPRKRETVCLTEESVPGTPMEKKNWAVLCKPGLVCEHRVVRKDAVGIRTHRNEKETCVQAETRTCHFCSQSKCNGLERWWYSIAPYIDKRLWHMFDLLSVLRCAESFQSHEHHSSEPSSNWQHGVQSHPGSGIAHASYRLSDHPLRRFSDASVLK